MAIMQGKYVIGMDFGTDSVRAILLDTEAALTMETAVSYFTRWKKGLYCNPDKDQYRQHPLDYIEAIDDVLTRLLKDVSLDIVSRIAAIGTNTTGSTPVAVDQNAMPLALQAEFEDNPHAMFILWKDHTAMQEANEINALAKKWPVDYTLYSGGIYSSEWFWAKILYTNRRDAQVKEKAFTWLEQSDWIPSYLAGITKPSAIKRNRCAAGHKAMWSANHGGLPAMEFLCSLDPSFYGLQNRFYQDTYTSDETLGTISPYFVSKFGFNPQTLITVGAIDAHHGAIGAGIKPYTLVKVIGTSTCDMLTIPKEVNPPLVAGICGQVLGSIDPDSIGFEAGQSAFGDIYQWFKQLLLAPTFDLLGSRITAEDRSFLEDNLLDYLGTKAASLPIAETDLVFTDYFNGRRTPDADFSKLAAAMGFNLATGAAQLFKALVTATVFGSKAIIERFESAGIPIKEVIATGGIAYKSAYVMQVMADVLDRDIKVVDSAQTCALGSAIFAAKAAGLFADVHTAKAHLAAQVKSIYRPNMNNHESYNVLYHKYKILANL